MGSKWKISSNGEHDTMVTIARSGGRVGQIDAGSEAQTFFDCHYIEARELRMQNSMMLKRCAQPVLYDANSRPAWRCSFKATPRSLTGHQQRSLKCVAELSRP